MGKNISRKDLDASAVANLLSELSKQLDAGKATFDADTLEASGEVKLGSGKASIRVRLTQVEGLVIECDAAPELPSYKKLKARMKKELAYLKEELDEWNLPSSKKVKSFCDNCRLMVKFPGKGDDGYDDFISKVNDFEEFCNDGDIEAAVRALKSLRKKRKNCHAKYA